MIVEINGVKYQQIERLKRKPLPRIAQMALLMGGVYGIGIGGEQDEQINFNYVREYELIQNKKSKLSKAKRDGVVRYFERHFKQID